MTKSNIYTRSGDEGTTSLVGGARVPKTDARLEAYGTLDELNAQIGLLSTVCPDEACAHMLQAVQHDLFDLGTLLATPAAERHKVAAYAIGPERVSALEEAIDHLQTRLPALHAFVLPGGCAAAARAHVCRTVCRRAERRILSLEAAQRPEPTALAYVNRLSDYLFVLARYFNFLTGTQEIVYRKR